MKNINIKNYNVEKDEKLQKLEEYSENKNTKKYLFKVDFMGIYKIGDRKKLKKSVKNSTGTASSGENSELKNNNFCEGSKI